MQILKHLLILPRNASAHCHQFGQVGCRVCDQIVHSGGYHPAGLLCCCWFIQHCVWVVVGGRYVSELTRVN